MSALVGDVVEARQIGRPFLIGAAEQIRPLVFLYLMEYDLAQGIGQLKIPDQFGVGRNKQLPA